VCRKARHVLTFALGGFRYQELLLRRFYAAATGCGHAVDVLRWWAGDALEAYTRGRWLRERLAIRRAQLADLHDVLPMWIGLGLAWPAHHARMTHDRTGLPGTTADCRQGCFGCVWVARSGAGVRWANLLRRRCRPGGLNFRTRRRVEVPGSWRCDDVLFD